MKDMFLQEVNDHMQFIKAVRYYENEKSSMPLINEIHLAVIYYECFINELETEKEIILTKNKIENILKSNKLLC